MPPTDQPPGWMITDKGRGLVLFALRYYTWLLIGVAILAFGLGALCGWAVAQIVLR